MKRIVHLSDMHFGSADPGVVEQVVVKINEIAPDVVVVSGDLTQRARTREFKAAREFLDRLPGPQIVVPGNHDLPLYNIFSRFISPLDKYKRFITDDMSPTHFDDEIVIVGVNTARSSAIKGGRINEEQIRFIEEQFGGMDDSRLKIVVTHHPFDLPEDSHHSDVVGRADLALPQIARCGGEVLLAGHLHVSHIETTAKRYKLDTGHVALVIQAGTATSARVRGERHSFNLIEYDDPRLGVTRLEYADDQAGFLFAEEKLYEQTDKGWDRLA